IPEVISVVEEERVVERAVVTHGAAHVLEVSLHLAEREPAEPPGEPRAEKEARPLTCGDEPGERRRNSVRGKLHAPAPPPGTAGMVRDMTVAPERLRQAEHRAEQR